LVVNLLFSFVPVATAYYFTMQSLGGRSGGSNWLTKLLQKIQTPLLNLSILLFVGLLLAWVSNLLFALEITLTPVWGSRLELVLCLLLIASFLVLLLGFAANSNDISLHYFYRDRLSEAYLRTDGRVGQADPEDGHKNSPGRPAHELTKDLFVANLRNHENLRLFELGEDNFKAPYHLIVSALNLQGSRDLANKTLKSDHFIFSKYFIGSRTTGYARTDHYRNGSTKLSTAMAISAAAVASGMGLLSFAASNFYMTLFNLRTGYWIENPWYLHQEALEDAAKKPSKWTLAARKRPFWLLYLLREFSGRLSAGTRRVYVSDGGHTGDNLGLLPLIQRRCSTIVVADFEADGSYSFASFAQAVRLAKSIYNVDINIDLTKLMPHKSDDGEVFSPCSVVEGVVTYNIGEEVIGPDGNKKMQYSKKIGKIVYMKSSISLLQEAAEMADNNTAPPLVIEQVPVMVLNYFKRNPKFPHQTTADQFFDEVQFEAHRMLGEHIGKQAARTLTFTALK